MVDRPTPFGPADATPDYRAVPPLALRANDMAKALSISPRLLAILVAEGRIPFARINRVVVFPIHLVEDWLTAEAGKQARP